MTSLTNGLGGPADFGENNLGPNDDVPVIGIDLTPVFANGINFLGTTYTTVTVSNNGDINFGGSNAVGSVPLEATAIPRIAVYFDDVDTQGGSQPASPGGTSTGSNLVYWDLDAASGTFTATWDDVRAYSGEPGVNAFQLQLIQVGGPQSTDFDIRFTYEDIQWASGARIGYTDGTGRAVELLQSGNNAALLNLENIVGQVDFQIRAGAPLQGSMFADRLIGNSGNDALQGNGGNDILDGGGGGDALDGGTGIDTASYEFAGAGVIASLLDPTTNTGDAADDTYVSIENLQGSAFDDILTGNAGRNVLEGGDGADTLTGIGTGDVVSYLNAAFGVIVDLTDSTNNAGDAAGDIITNLDIVYGSRVGDIVIGNGNANLIYGQGGDDILFGEGGNDKLFVRGNPSVVDGGDGVDQLQLLGGGTFTFTDDDFSGIEGVVVNSGQTADFSGVTTGTLLSSRSTTSGATIVGGSGGDKIKAGAAGDTITGGGGADVLSAGAGADTFRYATAGFGRDVLYGIDTASDHIDLRGLADSLGDLMLRESGSGASLATTVTIAGTQPGDAIALRGVSAAEIQANAGFFQLG